MKDVPGFYFIKRRCRDATRYRCVERAEQIGAGRVRCRGSGAGTRSINWILSLLIPGTDDGKVSIARTRLEGMNDHLTMAVTHPFMMKNDKVIAQVVYYLKNGSFMREGSDTVNK